MTNPFFANRLYLLLLLAGCASARQSEPVTRRIPARSPDALTGTAFIAAIADSTRENREVAIERELLSGNIPSHLRQLRKITVTTTGADGIKHVVIYEVMPDYLAIGSDADFVRIPLSPHTAQAFCDAFGFVLPTRKMVNDIWAAADVRVEPRPLTHEREAPLTFLQHHRLIEEQLPPLSRRGMVAGIKKDIVVTNKLSERPGRIAIFGWHHPDGKPIQPLYTGHVDRYVDYSHGARPVAREMYVDGRRRPYEEILKDPTVLDLLSDEGEILLPRYNK